MFRPLSRTLLRSTAPFGTPSRSAFPTFGRRFASTAPADKPRTWKSSATRWGVVIAGLYYYNSSKMFAEEPVYAVQLPETDRETETLPTIDELATQRRQQVLARQPASSSTANSDRNASVAATSEEGASPASPQELEEEAEGQGAFNPETGEINWDCPCLGGMANGPCGEQFKAAFSCFVYSKEEPKGIDCIENFKNMQDCFRQYPEVYGAELEDDDEDDESQTQKQSPGEELGSVAAEGKDTATPTQSVSSTPAGDTAAHKVAAQKPGTPTLTPEEIQQKRQRAKSAAEQVKSEQPILSETDEAVPKAWHDTTSSKDGK